MEGRSIRRSRGDSENDLKHHLLDLGQRDGRPRARRLEFENREKRPDGRPRRGKAEAAMVDVLFLFAQQTRLAPYNERHVWISTITDACGYLPMQFGAAVGYVDNYIWSIRFCPILSHNQLFFFFCGHDTDYVVAPFIADNKLSTSPHVRGWWRHLHGGRGNSTGSGEFSSVLSFEAL
jgi:hypothetical protein